MVGGHQPVLTFDGLYLLTFCRKIIYMTKFRSKKSRSDGAHVMFTEAQIKQFKSPAEINRFDAHIGEGLRNYYQSIVDEPIPDRLLNLVKTLSKQPENN